MNPRTAWRAHAGFLAWPTLALALGVWAATIAVWALVLVGPLPIAVGSLLMIGLTYVAFTPMHEAAHGNVAGRSSTWAALDPLVGWAMAILLVAPYPAFRALHLRHHGCTNDASRDPDIWVAGAWWTVPLRCLTIVPHYYIFFFSRLPAATAKAQRQRVAAIAVAAGMFLVAAALTAAGLGRAVLWLWAVPGLIGAGLLAFAFDYVPHVPHRVQGRYVDTRTIPGRALNWLLLGQNYHGVHHLYPRVPFFRYRTVFGLIADDMEAQGSPIRRPTRDRIRRRRTSAPHRSPESA